MKSVDKRKFLDMLKGKANTKKVAGNSELQNTS